MKLGLIGYTGFVGSNLALQHTFDKTYNSKNIQDIKGEVFDLVISAANRAEMWRINQEPDKDLAEINDYIGHIKKAKISKLVLISTVGVYKEATGVDEDTVISAEELLPYGKNRLYLENFCRENFDTTIVRLPGLFGANLKKNVIYDLLHNNNLDKIHKDGRYQYYNLANIWKDIQVAINNSLKVVNFATEPVSTEEVAKEAFGVEFENMPEGIKPAEWDMRTKYGNLFGADGHYLYNKERIIQDIKVYVDNEKARA